MSLSRFLPVLALLTSPAAVAAQDAEAPAMPFEQPAFENTVPTGWETEIYVSDDEGARRAQMILDLYEVLENDPTVENVSRFVREDYIQHNSLLPNGAAPLAMLFTAATSQFPVIIDVYRIAIVGDFGMAHVNFRNLDNDDPDDLGVAAVDMYLWDENGLIAEHWDTLQDVPALSANPNTEFLRLFEGNQ